MIHNTFHDVDTGTWTHVFACPTESTCIVIDSVLNYDAETKTTNTESIDQVIALIETNDWQLKYILETHAHADHLTAAQILKQRLGGEVCIGRGIVEVQQTFKDRLPLGDDFKADGSDFDLLLSEGDVLCCGRFPIEVMTTPGHTSDSLTYLIEDFAVIGDTLFHPDSGSARCDFPGGDAAVLYHSIKKILSLPADTKLCLAHDYPENRAAVATVSVAEQKESNIHCKTPFEAEQYIAIRTQRDAQLDPPKLIKPSLIHNVKAGH
ncbi:MBL fold metallo-hydrolase [Marinicella rhabdoformis]|uniref:MBL fold metallo-hydrolase n=1 Tax=Marinicella rhabdoformis TaxID=2580566 RepID=UPI0012AECEBC|nr:MBL fold metallo-hydrolase [Marinicella rhabdoformis]